MQASTSGRSSCLGMGQRRPLCAPRHCIAGIGATTRVTDRAASQLANVASSAFMTGSRVKQAKTALLEAVEWTRRGSNTTAELRSLVEEAQVEVEACAAQEIDYAVLEGKWRLVYTTAPDVLPILGLDVALPWAGLSSPVSIGAIYQAFTAPQGGRGRVQNIIEFGVAPLLEEGTGATLTVDASYEVRSSKRIALTFEEAQLGQVRISPAMEALLAPAVLPRGTFNMLALQALRQVRVVLVLAAQWAGYALGKLLTLGFGYGTAWQQPIHPKANAHA